MARNLTTRAVTVDDLPPATAAFVRAQAARRGLAGDPLAEVTHILRTDEETLTRLRSGPRVEHHTTEVLLTPELLIIAYRQGSDEGYLEVDPAARVSFHRLDQLELAAPPPGRTGARAATSFTRGVLSLESTPLGGARRTTRHLPTGDDPDATRFRDALRAALERSRTASP